MPLSYTPRKFISHPTNNYFYAIEADHRVFGDDTARQRVEELVSFLEFISVLDSNFPLSTVKVYGLIGKLWIFQSRSSGDLKPPRALGAPAFVFWIP